MADINITVDSSQVKSTKQELLELGNSFNSASKSASIFAQAFARAAKQSQRDEQYIKATSLALRNLINDNMKITNAYKSAEQSASAFTQELRKQEAQAVKTARANQEAFNKQLGVGGPSAVSQGAGGSAMEAEIERLRVKYDKIYASSNLYEKSLAELSRAHMLGVTSTKQHEAAVESLNLEYQNFQNGIAQAGNRFSQYSAQSASRMGQFGVVTQQAGYQIGDFLVQIQSGTNWMVAFGQQATQLVGVLPLMGAGFMGLSAGGLVALSAGLGIAIPLITAIGALWMRSTVEVEDGSKRQKEAIDSIVESTRTLRLERQMALSGAETTQEQEALNILNGLLEDRAKIQARINDLTNLGSRATGYAAQAEGSREVLQAEVESLDAKIKALSYERELGIAVKSRAADVREAYRADRDRVAAGEAIYKGLLAVQSANQSIIRSNAQISETVQTAIGHYANMRTVAAGVANEMTRAASASFALAQQNLAAGGLTYSGRGGNPAKVNQQGGAFVYEGPSLDSNNMPVISGGGGGDSEPSESMLEKLQKQLDIEKELLGTTETYQRVRSALGDEFINTSPMIVEGLMQQATEIENLTRLEEERQSLMDSVNGTLEGGFMAMVKGTKTVGEAFKDMAAAILEELFRVLVVQKLVAGFTGSPGGVGIGGLFGGGKRASGGSMMSGQPYLVGEQGPELVIPRHSGTVVNANQTAGAMAGSGGFTQNLSINVTGSDAAMVRQEVAKMIPQITSATKAAVIDAKQRGGQMAAAFR